jgi:hypothetical protein
MEMSTALETAKGITDYGALAVMGGIFLTLAAGMMIAIFKWFKSIINNLIEDQSSMMEDLLCETKAQNETLAEIADGLRPKTLLEVKSISNTCFDLSVERVCRMIKKVREENHIANREATESKIELLLTNLHEDRNSRFDNHHFRGRPLTEYTSKAWIQWVKDVVINEVYSASPNNGRAYTNVNAIYDKIKLDFYNNVQHK